MSGDDPQLVEVKTSAKLDRRGIRQKRNLKILQDFFDTDKAVGLRGLPEIWCRTIEVPERTYVDSINICISDALKNGYSVVSPEQGLAYVVLTAKSPRIDDVLRNLGLKEPWVFYLNAVKTKRLWAPHFPFVLSIQDKAHLWKFIRGEVIIIVCVEIDSLCKIARDSGYEVRFERDNVLHLNVPGEDAYVQVSSQMLGRIAFEFVSLESPVLAAIYGFQQWRQERDTPPISEASSGGCPPGDGTS
jgi:hypothetical protein